MPKLEYPMDKTLTSGWCARGLVAFPVPSGKQSRRDKLSAPQRTALRELGVE
jgi:hypothetical protein